jgi:PAS domain S-box-containing protein
VLYPPPSGVRAGRPYRPTRSRDPAIEVITDLSGVVTGLQGEFAEFGGIEAIGQPFGSCFAESDRAERAIRQTLAGERIRGLQISLLSRSGAEILTRCDFRTARDDRGVLTGVTVSVATHASELPLEDSRLYQRALFEAAPGALLTIDRRMVIQDVNEELVKVSGYSRRHLLGNRLSMIAEDPAAAEEAVRQTLETGRSQDVALTLLTRDGLRVPVTFNGATFYDLRGQVRGVLATLRDVTEQRSIEAELKQHHLYNRALVESNLDVLVVTDLMGIIVDVNRQTERLLGQARNQIIGTRFTDLFLDPRRADEVIKTVLSVGPLVGCDLLLRGGDGRSATLSCSATTFRDDEGRLRGVLVVARDVSEQKRLRDRLLQQNEELESQFVRAQHAHRVQSESLATMSHELRTPLNSIIGFSEVLLTDEAASLSEAQREYVECIFNGGIHLLQMINDLLDLSKAESGKLAIEPEPFAPSELIAEILATLRPQLAEIQVSVEDLATDIGPVELDPRRYRQILFNLLSNAAKFTPAGGRVDIRLERVGTDRFATSISDSGIGISPVDLPRLFRPFEQLDSGPARRFTGSGLGLALTRVIVTRQEGTIEVHSEPGKGSTFRVVLPVRLPRTAA